MFRIIPDIKSNVLEVTGPLLQVSELILIIYHSLHVHLHHFGRLGDLILSHLEIIVVDTLATSSPTFSTLEIKVLFRFKKN